jgi:uncharacterized protein YfdQ (DUF2303 family)
MVHELNNADVDDFGSDEFDTDEFDGNDIQLALDAGRQMADPYFLETGKIWSLRTRHGVAVVDLSGDEYRDRPRRKTGTTTVDDIDSLLAYIGKHGDPDTTEVYACTQNLQFVAVLDAHGKAGEQADWCGHRVALSAEFHPRFATWKGMDRRWMTQEDMAGFIETNMSAVVEPDAATLLEIVSSFQAVTNVAFKAGIQTQSGQRVLSYVESTSASAGAKGEIQVPAQLTLGLPVFRASRKRDVVEARFQFRVRQGDLSMRYVLVDLDDVIQAGFAEFTTSVQSWLSEAGYGDLLLGRPSR